MLIALSGYCASGKSTLAGYLDEHLAQIADVPCAKRRFDSLYLSSKITRKPKRKANTKVDGSLGLRQIEGERGSWDRPFGVKQLVDIVWASLAVHWLRLRWRGSVLLLDRYFIDRFIHFDPRGWLYRIAWRLAPKADLHFILLPDVLQWEQRILGRLKNRFDLELSQLPRQDRQELEFVRERYARLVDQDRVLAINSSSEQGCREALRLVLRKLDSGRSDGETPCRSEFASESLMEKK